MNDGNESYRNWDKLKEKGNAKLAHVESIGNNMLINFSMTSLKRLRKIQFTTPPK